MALVIMKEFLRGITGRRSGGEGKTEAVVQQKIKPPLERAINPVTEPDLARLMSLLTPGVLRGTGIKRIATTTGHGMTVDLDRLENPQTPGGRDAVIDLW